MKSSPGYLRKENNQDIEKANIHPEYLKSGRRRENLEFNYVCKKRDIVMIRRSMKGNHCEAPAMKQPLEYI